MTKEQIEQRLRAAGAFYVSDWDDLHELWATAWSRTWLIPMAGPFGQLDEADLIEIEREIVESRP